MDANKKLYFKKLRESWNNAKKLLNANKLTEIEAIIANHGLNISATGFYFVSLQMQNQHLDGLPYLDAKTYQGWKENGFQVKKGEHSTLSGVTWITCGRKSDGKIQQIESANISDDSFMLPKEYRLFHRTQVEEI